MIEGALRIPDGYWRVEVVRYSPGRRWYRIIHGTTVVAEKAAIGTVQDILGADFASLEPVEAA